MTSMLSASSHHVVDRDALIDVAVICFFLLLFAPIVLGSPYIGLPVPFQLLAVVMIAFLGYDAATIRSPISRYITVGLCMLVLVAAASIQLLLGGIMVPIAAVCAILFVLLRLNRPRTR